MKTVFVNGHEIRMNGADESDKLTPKMARSACIIAGEFGTVSDERNAYIVSKNSTRHIKPSDEDLFDQFANGLV